MSGGRSQPATTTVVQQQEQRNDPWAPLVPHLTDLFTRGRTALEQTPNTVRDTYVGPNQDQQTALGWMRDVAGRAGTGASELRQLGLDTVNGRYLSPDSNPFLREAVNAATRPYEQRLVREVLPGLADQAILGGAYGGSGHGVSQGVATADTARAMADVAAGMYGQNYQIERDRQMNAGTLFNQANTLDLTPAQILDLVGSQQREWDQGALDARNRAELEAPWAGLDRYAALLGLGGQYGTSSGSGTSTTTQQMARPSGFASFLQGALGGASAGASFGPWGALIGALGGGAAGGWGR